MKKAKQSPEKSITLESAEKMMIQLHKEANLHSLLYVARKLGEVEGMICTQKSPDKALVAIQEDLKQLHNKLVEDAGIELIPELGGESIGGDSGY